MTRASMTLASWILLISCCPSRTFAFVSTRTHARSMMLSWQRHHRLLAWMESRQDNNDYDEYDEAEECGIFDLDACSEEDVKAMANGFSVASSTANQTSFADTLKYVVKQPIVEVLLVILVFVSVFVVGLGTLQSLPPMVLSVCQGGEIAVSAIFTVEYLVRWYLKGFSPTYVVQPLALIDLIAILPGIMSVVSMLGVAVPSSLLGGALINLRLLRVLRLQRVLKDDETFGKFRQALGLDTSDIRPYQLQLARVVISIFTLMSVTAGLVYSAEHVVNPNIPNYFTALYFALTTISTVGFGDISCVTPAGRWAVSASILIGVAVVPAQAAALAETLLNSTPTMDDEKTLSTNSGDTGTNTVLSLESLDTRMGMLETKLNETNAKLDKILELLE